MFMIRAIIYAGNGTPDDDYDNNYDHMWISVYTR